MALINESLNLRANSVNFTNIICWSLVVVISNFVACGQRDSSPSSDRYSGHGPVLTDPGARAAVALPTGAAGWTMTEDGPVFPDDFTGNLGLDEESAGRANDALQTTYQQYLEIEAKYTKITKDGGYDRVDIKPLSNSDLAQLEDSLWSGLDPLLDRDQQGNARKQLEVFATPGSDDVYEQNSDWKAVMPGLLGWGKAGCRVSIRKAGSWYEWHVSTGPSYGAVWMDSGQPRSGTVYPYNHSDKGPDLPSELQRFVVTTGNRENSGQAETPSK